MRTPAVLCSVAVVFASGAASAGDVASVVILEGDPAGPAETKTIDAIRAQVGDLPVTVFIEHHGPFTGLRAELDWATEAARNHHARGVFWVDADAAGDTLLYLFEPDGARLLVRRIEREGDAEAVIEEVANVAHSIIDALASGRHVGMTALPVPRRPVVVQPTPLPPPPSVPFSVVTGIGVVADSMARTTWTSGLRASLAGRFSNGISIGAGYGFIHPVTIDSTATLELAPHPVDLWVGWEGRPGRLMLDVEAGTKLDAVTSATLPAPGITPAPRSTAWSFALTVDLGIGWRFVPWMGVYTRAGVDVFLTKTTYTVGDAALFTPDFARLHVEGGLTFVSNAM